MKALTICQPYAHLICLPDTDARRKRVENREWSTRYRGPLFIHAGMSRAWLTDGPRSTYDSAYGLSVGDMTFGAFVARCTLVDCISYADVGLGLYRCKYPWVASHQHASGPWCWILADVSPLPRPVPWRGAQGLWEVEELEVIAAAESMLKEPAPSLGNLR